MKWILSPSEIKRNHRNLVGGKAFALSIMAREGFEIPETLFLTVEAYHEFVSSTGLRERILLELNRKDFKDMRWEEIWDCATRIRNLFLKKPIPKHLDVELTAQVQSRFDGKTVAVRSSAPDEDATGSSFAGLHESFINVRGTESIIKHVRLVWASLWSDAALLYRQEIGLDVEKSAMAVVLQETVAGNRSGVVFSQNPSDETQGIIESVYGLNQGLVDGRVEPDRWILDREKLTILSHNSAERSHWLIPSEHGVEMVPLPQNLSQLPPISAEEIKRRWEINHEWVKVYWEEFIPYAHGIRLFGQYYNDAVQPDDPYEFMNLLTHTQMASLKRNRMLKDLAEIVRSDSELLEKLQAGEALVLNSEFEKKIDEFIIEFGDLSCAVTGGAECATDARPIFKLLVEMATNPSSLKPSQEMKDAGTLEKNFLGCFQGPKRKEAMDLLDLARSSYRLRDDDNIYLGRIEAQLLTAVMEGKTRVENSSCREIHPSEIDKLKSVIHDLDYGNGKQELAVSTDEYGFKVNPRQLVGQPAGPGLSRGKARVIRHHLDLQDFKNAEILVCDSVDPNMTFVIPLAAGVVERRGGMLIHGAIIAREYGLPCVTGIPDATSLIRTGDEITVDGYLGIVTLLQKDP